MIQLPPYKIFPLGDSVLVIDFGNVIDEALNKVVHSLFQHLHKESIPGIIELVPGYSSLSICYDVFNVTQKLNGHGTAYSWMSDKINQLLVMNKFEDSVNDNIVKVPVCYDSVYGPDLSYISDQNKISITNIIQIHISTIYRIYMLGFLPGFAYMGELDEQIACPRKSKPVFVEAGSVGIAGKQTGIYPLRSPGGWQVIGRTPIKLFNKDKNDPVFFKPGNNVQFYSITKDEFEDIKSRNA